MEAKLFLHDYRCKKLEVRRFVKKVMFTRMVADNIIDLIPSKWNIRNYGTMGILVEPREGCEIPINDFDKLVAKLARSFNKQPYMNVDEKTVNATFYVYPSLFKESEGVSVMIDIRTTNTEKCEFITVEKVVTETQPTGYCKLLSEKHYKLHMS